MKHIFKLILLGAIIALGVWLWLIFFPSPQKIIRERLVELAGGVSFSPADGTLARLASVQEIAGLFSTNVEINIDVPGRMQHTITGRDEITQAALASRSTLSGLTVKFPDMNITVARDKQSATVDLTIEATVAGDHDAIVQEMKFTFRKMGGHWLITHGETVRPVS